MADRFPNDAGDDALCELSPQGLFRLKGMQRGLEVISPHITVTGLMGEGHADEPVVAGERTYVYNGRLASVAGARIAQAMRRLSKRSHLPKSGLYSKTLRFKVCTLE